MAATLDLAAEQATWLALTMELRNIIKQTNLQGDDIGKCFGCQSKKTCGKDKL
jgi:hypothetical protein